jgi:hypothetical protein
VEGGAVVHGGPGGTAAWSGTGTSVVDTSSSRVT